MSNHSYRDKFTIGAIYEKDGITPKKSHQFRVGRTGKVINLNDDTPMAFEYSDGHGVLQTSRVIEVQEDDYGVLVTTENTIYRLDDYVEKEKDNCDNTIIMEAFHPGNKAFEMAARAQIKYNEKSIY